MILTISLIKLLSQILHSKTVINSRQLIDPVQLLQFQIYFLILLPLDIIFQCITDIAAVCKEEPSPIREPLEASIGVILAPWDSEYNMDVYLNQADEAMYEEKKMYHEKYGDRRRR